MTALGAFVMARTVANSCVPSACETTGYWEDAEISVSQTGSRQAGLRGEGSGLLAGTGLAQEDRPCSPCLQGIVSALLSAMHHAPALQTVPST